MLYSANNSRAKAFRKITLWLAAGAALLLTSSLGVARTNPAEPEMVSVYLNVEKGGKLIGGLGEKNFRLYVDGKPQPFRLAKPEVPASIALLVEHSNSSLYYYDDFEGAINGFMKYALEGNWYALGTYAQGLQINVDFTNLTGEIADGWSALGPPSWSEINTYDAIYDMLDKLGRLPGRRILIVIGSGIDTFSEHSLDDVKKKLEAVDAVVFVAGAGSPFRGTAEGYLNDSGRLTFLQAQAFLQMLANSSGGFAWFPNQYAAFPDVIQGVMQSIETQYRLVCQRPVWSDGKLHKIKVEAFRIVDDKREDFQVLVRSGWR